MNQQYKLNGHEPVLCGDTKDWCRWFETANRHVADDKFGDVRVSTVFLGLDHSFGIGGPPLLFETMVFGGPLNEETGRYTTWDQAECGHDQMCAEVLAHKS